MNYERDRFCNQLRCHCYDAVGAVVNDESDIDIIFRLMDMEGEMLFLRAMKTSVARE